MGCMEGYFWFSIVLNKTGMKKSPNSFELVNLDFKRTRVRNPNLPVYRDPPPFPGRPTPTNSTHFVRKGSLPVQSTFKPETEPATMPPRMTTLPRVKKAKSLANLVYELNPASRAYFYREITELLNKERTLSPIDYETTSKYEQEGIIAAQAHYIQRIATSRDVIDPPDSEDMNVITAVEEDAPDVVPISTILQPRCREAELAASLKENEREKQSVLRRVFGWLCTGRKGKRSKRKVWENEE